MTTATKYKTYSKYKSSGIDWLGDIPAGWEIKRLRYFFDYHAGGVWGDEEKGDQNDLICLRVADFDFNHFGLSRNDLTTRNIPENQHSRVLEKGDILLEKSGGGEKQTVGRAVRFDSNDRAVCSNFIEKLTPLKVHDSKYISYLMGALYFGTINIRSIKQTTGIQNLDIYAYFSEVVPFPEKTIQKSIADFLDRETAKIDKMVAKKQKMMELLKEKRQALITHAVTKGLSSFAKASADKDPKTKMKPSGIDWLGDIPAGWEIKRFGFLFSFNKGLSITKENLQDEGIPCVNYGEIHSKYGFEVNPLKNELQCVSTSYLENNQGSVLHYGDFVFADTSEDVEGAGNFTYLNSHELTFAGYHTIVTRPKIKIHFRFLAYLFDSVSFRTQIRSMVAGIKVYSITKDILKNSYVLLPPSTEQVSIATFLDHEMSKIDEMMKKVETQIGKLQEYRQALITSAVTGKIKI